MKAADILKAHQTPLRGSLQTYWKSRMALIRDGYQKPLTGKECGQLKQLQTYLGDQTRPVIAYTIEYWWKFASRAAAEAGVPMPTEPNIGFLLKHHAVAVHLLTPKAVSTVSPPGETVEPVQSVAPTEPPAHELTSQELTELLEGLKSP